MLKVVVVVPIHKNGIDKQLLAMHSEVINILQRNSLITFT